MSRAPRDRKSTRLNSSHLVISYAVFCLKKKKPTRAHTPLESFLFFFFNDTATTEIYTLSLHDALPISKRISARPKKAWLNRVKIATHFKFKFLICLIACSSRSSRMHTKFWCHVASTARSEEHTSELQSPCNLVCRLLLEKKKTNESAHTTREFSLFFF